MSAVPFAVMQETLFVGAVCTSVDVYVGVYVGLQDAEDSHFQLLQRSCRSSYAQYSNVAADHKHQVHFG